MIFPEIASKFAEIVYKIDAISTKLTKSQRIA